MRKIIQNGTSADMICAAARTFSSGWRKRSKKSLRGRPALREPAFKRFVLLLAGLIPV